MKNYKIHFICACAIVAMLSSQNFLVGAMEAYHTELVGAPKKQTAFQEYTQYLKDVLSKNLGFVNFSGQLSPEKTITAMTAENLAEHNNSQNSSGATSSQTRSLGIEMPQNQLNPNSTTGSASPTSSQRSGSSSPISHNMPKYSTRDKNSRDFVDHNELTTIDFSSTSEQPTTPAQLETSFLPPTQKNLAEHNNSQRLTASQNSSRATSSETGEIAPVKNIKELDLHDTSSISSQSGSDSSDAGLPLKIYNPSKLDVNSQILSRSNSQSNLGSSDNRSTTPTIPKSSSPTSIQNDWTVIDLSNQEKEVTNPAPQKNNFPAGLQFAINASDAASRLGTAMYDATGHVGTAVRTIPGEIYKAPGNVAKNVFGHPDGNIRTGNAYSIASAGDVLYDSAEYAGAAAGRAISSAVKSARRNILSPKKGPQTTEQERLSYIEQHTEQGMATNLKNKQNNTSQQPTTVQKIQAYLAQLDVMNWFKSHKINPTITTPEQKSYINQIIDYATKNLNPVDGIKYLNTQLNKLFGTKPTSPNNHDNLASAPLQRGDGNINKNYNNANDIQSLDEYSFFL